MRLFAEAVASHLCVGLEPSAIKIKAAKVPAFKPSKAMKELVNKPKRKKK